MKNRLFRIFRVRNDTGIVEVDGSHNVVSINRITLAKTAEKAMQATKIEHHNYVLSKCSDTKQGFAMVRIVCHNDDKGKTKNLVG